MKRLIAVAGASLFALTLGCAQQEKKSQPAAAAPAEAPAAAAAPAPGPGDRGNWAVIDKNKDNYIQAEEMEAWLKANPGPGAKKK
ncbi:MAG: hypothetical protein ACREV2_14400 [Burkholderiales bacterium]